MKLGLVIKLSGFLYIKQAFLQVFISNLYDYLFIAFPTIRNIDPPIVPINKELQVMYASHPAHIEIIPANAPLSVKR